MSTILNRFKMAVSGQGPEVAAAANGGKAAQGATATAPASAVAPVEPDGDETPAAAADPVEPDGDETEMNDTGGQTAAASAPAAKAAQGTPAKAAGTAPAAKAAEGGDPFDLAAIEAVAGDDAEFFASAVKGRMGAKAASAAYIARLKSENAALKSRLAELDNAKAAAASKAGMPARAAQDVTTSPLSISVLNGKGKAAAGGSLAAPDDPARVQTVNARADEILARNPMVGRLGAVKQANDELRKAEMAAAN